MNGDDVVRRSTVATSWTLERPTPAVAVSRTVHWVFEHVLYRVGIRGATTVARAATRWASDRDAVLVNGLGARFAFPAWDSYYGHYLFGGRPYEPELALLLACHAQDADATFVDGGANYGYWSVVASSLLTTPAVAVELSPETFDVLRRNAGGAGFVPVNAAIWDVDGVEMSVSDSGPNQSFSAQVGAGPGGVRSRSIDSLVAEHGMAPEHLLVKVDCEGAEVQALAGATTAISGGACLVLEDHGSDADCTVSRRVLELGLHLAVFDEGSQRWREVETIDAVRRVKSDPVRGYNIFVWPGRLRPSLEAAFA